MTAAATTTAGDRPPGTLYLVPTPIGNPRDITMRAADVLAEVAVVACEDTRHARSLLQALGVRGQLVSYHDHNEEPRTQQLLARLAGGDDVALISDAGTPLINDPGYRIVTAAIAAGLRVRPLPGPSAVLTALIGSGLPANTFHYAGFLPRRQAARQAALAQLRDTGATLIFLEAPHRALAAVRDMHEILGDRRAALACNLTKADESFARGPLSALAGDLAARAAVRGQYTIVVGGADRGDHDEAAGLAGRLTDALLRQGLAPRLIREAVGEVTGLPRNWVYEHVQAAAAAASHG